MFIYFVLYSIHTSSLVFFLRLLAFFFVSYTFSHVSHIARYFAVFSYLKPLTFTRKHSSSQFTSKLIFSSLKSRSAQSFILEVNFSVILGVINVSIFSVSLCLFSFSVYSLYILIS